MKNEVINKMKMEFDSLPCNESFARQTVCAFASQADPTLEEISDLRVIVSEAVTNCVVHAYKKGPGRIYLSASLLGDGSIRVKIKDKGCGIEDIEQCMQPLFTTDPEGERGGMGFAIMKAFSEKFKVSSVPGEGTTVSFTMRFHRG